MPMPNSKLPNILLASAMILASAIYYQGLAGPYLFDDFWNLTIVEKWAAGSLSWRQALLPNATSIVDSRPVAMASFMFTTWLSGAGTFPLKAGNLFIHLLVGISGWQFLRQALRQDHAIGENAALLASIGAAIWVMHPLHVSTVLYAVQRMTQLSTLFTILAVIAYFHGRVNFVPAKSPTGLALLFVAFPILWALGVLSKQNAIVAPFLCLVIEVAYFGSSWLKAPALKAFYFMFAFIPLAAAAVVLALKPEIVTAGYADWDFTLAQRMLTQPRVLASYIGALMIPYAPAMGLYTDDYLVSASLFDPRSTAFAILGLACVSAIAIWLRKIAPSFFAGWFFFLIAHSLEASPLPLEMYYEHRNYLPSFGLILAISGLGNAGYRAIQSRMTNPRFVASAGVVLLIIALSFATLGRVLVWEDKRTIVEQGLAQHPRSLHAILDAVALAIEESDFPRAIEILEPLTVSDSRRTRMVANLYLASIQCAVGPALDTSLLKRVVADVLPRLTVYDVQMMKSLEAASQQPPCRGKAEAVIAATFAALIDQATLQPESGTNKSVPRELTARLYARAGNWSKAEGQAKIAWEAGHNAPTGALLARIYLQSDRKKEAQAVIDELSSRIDRADQGGQAELHRLRAMLAEDHLPQQAGALR